MDGAGPDLLDALWRYRRMVVLVTLLFLALSTGAGLLIGSQARAEATVALTAPSSQNVLSPGLQGDAALARYTQQRALFVRSDDVLTAAMTKLPGTTLSGLRGAVSVNPSSTSTSMVLVAKARTTAQAIEIVDRVVDAYRDETRKQVAERTSAALSSIEGNSAALRRTLAGQPTAAVASSAATTLSDLNRQASALQTDSAVFSDGVEFVQAATKESATGPKLPLRELALGLLLGLAVAGTAAWLRADRDRRVSRPRQAESLLGAPLLGELPQVRHPLLTPAARASIIRHCRDILAPVLATGFRGVILVTGAERQVGCSTATLGVAAAAAAEGLRVLVVDGDPGSKGLTNMLGISAKARGLVEASSGDGLPPSASYKELEVSAGLVVAALPAGNLPRGEWDVTAAGLNNLVNRLRAEFDVIVIDAPTPGGEYVSSVLSGMVDGVIAVVRRDAQAAKLAELHQVFTLNRAPLIGYVFNFAQTTKVA
jgi:polysaccharide biosynthesis transport protein